MTDTYTEEQIREAVQDALACTNTPDAWSDAVIAALQRPAYVPTAGDVAWDDECKEYFICTKWQSSNNSGANFAHCRPLTRAECGPVGRALDVAVDELHNIRNKLSRNNCAWDEITEALSEIKRLEQSDE